MIEDIKKMTGNIGSLVLFIKNNEEYLNYLNSNIPVEVLDRKVSEKVYYLVNDIKSPILCLCGNHRSFIGFKNGYRKTCGDKDCIDSKRKETCIKNFGVDNPKKSPDIIKKEQEGIKEKYNGLHYMKTDGVSGKFKETMMLKYGVEFAQQSESIKEKSKLSFNKNPRKEEIIKNRVETLLNKSVEEKSIIESKKRNKIEERFGSYQEFINYRLDKIKEKSLQNFGTDHHFKSKEVIEKRINSYKNNIVSKILEGLPSNIKYEGKVLNTNRTDSILNLFCLNCEEEFQIRRQFFQYRKSIGEEICLNCNPILSGRSKRELEVFDFIKEIYSGDIQVNVKGVISKEIDIYIPELNLAFEFNGLYWHSELYKDKLYHLSKTEECYKKGVCLFHIWEDDWDLKKEIVKSMIINKFGKSERIFARKCEIKLVSSKESRIFLNENHIQGAINSKIRVGLYLGDELVSIMTFGSLRRSLGSNSEENTWELLRFCNKLGFSVVGGSSKLFKYFLKNYTPNKVVSYSDSSRSQGDMYKKLKFNFISETSPNYYWIIDGIKKHRFNFRKDRLVKEGFDYRKSEVQIMNERGYFRVFDCGSKKWVYLK